MNSAFAALADASRREILRLLLHKPRRAGELAAGVDMSPQALSRHLRVLRKAGLVTVVKRGQQRIYRLNAEGLKPVHDWVKVFERYWTHQVDQIKHRAERKALQRLIRLDDGTNQKKEE